MATSIDHEVERLGFDHIDILKLSISSMDILRLVAPPLRPVATLDLKLQRHAKATCEQFYINSISIDMMDNC